MNDLPKRKTIRIEDHDYSTPGAYFITVSTANKEKLFWNGVGADDIRPYDVIRKCTIESVGATYGRPRAFTERPYDQNNVVIQ